MISMIMIARGEIGAWGAGSGNEGPVLSEPERDETRQTRESRHGKICSVSFCFEIGRTWILEFLVRRALEFVSVPKLHFKNDSPEPPKNS